MSFISVTMVLMAGFVLIAPVAMAAILATGGRPFRQTVALAGATVGTESPAVLEEPAVDAALARAA